MSTKTETRQMPQSEESEIAVLGAVLLNSNETIDRSIELLTPESFYKRSHQIIFWCMVEMWKKKEPVDSITVTNKLQALGKLNEVGGAYYLSKMSVAFPTAAHLEHYIEILRQKFKLRRLIEVTSGAALKAYSCEDSKEIVPKIEADIFQISVDNVTEGNALIKGNEIVTERIANKRAGIKILGIPSGLKSFDLPTGGYRKGEYYTIAAQPGYGKTSWAEQSVSYAVLNEIPALFVSLEMSADRVMERMCSRMSGVPLWNYLNDVMVPEDYDKFESAKNRIMKSPLHLICPVDLTGPEFRSIVRRFKRKHGIEMVVLDYLQRMKSNTQRDERHVIREASSCVSDAVKESDVAGLIISQMNRMFDKEDRPRMAHLAESSQIERDSDFIGFIWPEKTDQAIPPNQDLPVVLTIEKNRDGPSRCDQKLNWLGSVLTFKEREGVHDSSEFVNYTGDYYETKS